MKFGNIRQRDRIFTDEIDEALLMKVTKLPPAKEAGLDAAYLLTKSVDGYKAGTTYIVRDIGEGLKWYDITLSEFGHLDKPSDVWKRTTDDSVALHWTTPPNIKGTKFIDGIGLDEATWSHDVVVRKFGSVPQTPSDGEVIGFSDVRDQYRTGDGFVCLHNRLEDDADDFVYRIFSVTISGQFTGSDTVVSSWNWRTIKEAVVAGTYKASFRLGDKFDLPAFTPDPSKPDEKVVLRATIVAFDNALDDKGTAGRPSITFMLDSVLGNKSFDNKELEYSELPNDSILKKANDEQYFRIKSGEYVQLEEGTDFKLLDTVGPIDTLMIHPSVTRWNTSGSSTELESRYGFHSGNGNWRDSNLRAWLNATDKNWFGWERTPMWSTTFDTPPSDKDSAFYNHLPPFSLCITDDDDSGFLESVSKVSLDTVTDGFVYRTKYDYEKDGDVVTQKKSLVSSIRTVDKFWVPSFEQIYGFVPTEGDAGKISNVGGDRGTGFTEVSEGSQFDILVPSANERKAGYYISSSTVEILTKWHYLTGENMQWYLRSVDQTVPSYVYVMSDSTRVSPSNKIGATNTTIPAHRLVGPDYAQIGPVVCFTIGEW